MTPSAAPQPTPHDRWAPALSAPAQPLLRLYCFPCAGGGPATFRTWPARLPEQVEVRVAQLPGHGPRLREPPFDQMTPLVHALFDALFPALDPAAEHSLPFAFFGHSLGALISFELARMLRQSGVQPTELLVAGNIAPQLPDPNPPLHQLPDAQFIEELKRLGGIPRQVLENPELLELFLPVLKADFAVLETRRHSAAPPLDCPIAVFGGEDDPRTSAEGLEAWRRQTVAGFWRKMFPGGHFFLDDDASGDQLLETLSTQLAVRLGGAV